MQPGRYDFLIYQGTTFEREIRVEQADGELFSLIGFTPLMQIRENYESEAALSVVCSVIDGKIYVELSATETEQLKLPRYVYDLEIHSTAGKVYRVLNGIITVSRQVTR